MEAEFRDKIVTLLLDGIDAYNFERILFTKFDSWVSITLDDIYAIIEEVKDNGLALYTFMPFCYKFLGIDLFQYYRDNVMTSNKSRNLSEFSNYPIQITNEFERVFRDYGIEEDNLFKMRKLLIEQGAHAVNKLQRLGKQEVFEFPSEWNS